MKLKTQPLAPAAPEAPAPEAPAPRRRLTLIGGEDAGAQARFAEAVRLQGPVRRRLTLVGGEDASVQARLAEAMRLQGRMDEEDVRRRRSSARVQGIGGVYGPRPL